MPVGIFKRQDPEVLAKEAERALEEQREAAKIAAEKAEEAARHHNKSWVDRLDPHHADASHDSSHTAHAEEHPLAHSLSQLIHDLKHDHAAHKDHAEDLAEELENTHRSIEKTLSIFESIRHFYATQSEENQIENDEVSRHNRLQHSELSENNMFAFDILEQMKIVPEDALEQYALNDMPHAFSHHELAELLEKTHDAHKKHELIMHILHGVEEHTKEHKSHRGLLHLLEFLREHAASHDATHTLGQFGQSPRPTPAGGSINGY